MGESFGHYQIGNDQALMPYIDAANIACGMHAGDPVQIERTIDLALAHEVFIGAHPGYPDLNGFGRRIIPMSQEELAACIRYQVAALVGMTKARGGKVTYVKPHGALYNQMAEDAEVAKTVVSAILEVTASLKIMGLAGSLVQTVVEDAGAQFIAEAFADRAYEDNGQLRSRKLAGAVYDDPKKAAKQVLSVLHEQSLTSFHGKKISIKAESFCIHGDNPAALQIAQVIRTAIQ